jgi:hypothetical protein
MQLYSPNLSIFLFALNYLYAIMKLKGEKMSKNRCEKIAEHLGGIIHDWDDLRLEAPKGKSMDGDVHEFVYSYRDGEKAQAWALMLEDLSYIKDQGGFQVCDNKAQDEDCEWCDGDEDGE